MSESVETEKYPPDASEYPGPRTFVASPEKWLRLTVIGVIFTVIGVGSVIRQAGPLAIFATAFCAIGTMLSVCTLLPGASLLRLDADGFEVTKFFFLKRRYNWAKVSDFGLWTMSKTTLVVFKAYSRDRGVLETMNAALAGGSNGYLPDTYGMSAAELAQTMTSWLNSAMDTNK